MNIDVLANVAVIVAAIVPSAFLVFAEDYCAGFKVVRAYGYEPRLYVSLDPATGLLDVEIYHDANGGPSFSRKGVKVNDLSKVLREGTSKLRSKTCSRSIRSTRQYIPTTIPEGCRSARLWEKGYGLKSQAHKTGSGFFPESTN